MMAERNKEGRVLHLHLQNEVGSSIDRTKFRQRVLWFSTQQAGGLCLQEEWTRKGSVTEAEGGDLEIER